MITFTDKDFKKRKKEAIFRGIQGSYAIASVILIRIFNVAPFSPILSIAEGVMCAAAVMLIGLGFLTFRLACLMRAMAKYPNHPIWGHESYQRIMYSPAYLTTWTWKQWDEALKKEE